ncbi:hypothetical protein AB0D08_01055 [Kitasatospora sp. NPDC048540]|uniref:hypothetical protein n=1 Tax=unclassified Kitasatospora TaxID=2633591 RepID=UPI00053A5041|nr:hypothetical protein [Kitasatospora sp. MBT63]
MMLDLSGCEAELRRRGLVPTDCMTLFSVGSVARGWANQSSDFDFYLVSRSVPRIEGARTVPVPLGHETISTFDFPLDGRRWEVAYWLDSQVDQMLSKVTWSEFDAGVSSLKVMVDTEELFLERIRTGLPLLGEDWLDRRRVELADTAYQAFLTTRSLAEADGNVEDALGMLVAGDIESAVMAARKALGHAVDALLESHGNYGSRTPKWRARRVKEAALRELPFERYWALETMADYDARDPADWVRRVVTLCKDLSVEVEI